MKLGILFLVGVAMNEAVSQNVRINELMYAPAGGEPEWKSGRHLQAPVSM